MSFDILEFARVWRQIYEHLHDIGYITLGNAESLPGPDDFPANGPRVALPPHVEPSIDLEKCAELDLDNDVVELLQAIPHPLPDEANSFSLFPRSKPNSFLESSILHLSRNPSGLYYSFPDLASNQDIKKWEIALTNPVPGGLVLLLDVKAGTIREIQNDRLPIQAKGTYHDQPAEPAIEKIRLYLENLRNLDWLAWSPDAQGGIIEKEAGELHRRMVLIITRNYGWPDNFRREDWKRDSFTKFQEVMDAIS